MKQLEPNPYEQLTEKYPPGTVVKGHVRNIADFGIFVEIEEGIDGLVHITDMSWTQRVKHPSELFKKGDEVEAVLLNIDTGDGDKPKISLGIKQLVADPWDRIPYDYPAGKIVDGKVAQGARLRRVRRAGDRASRASCTCPEISEEHVEDPRTVLTPGSTVKVPGPAQPTAPSARSGCRSRAPRVPRRWRTRRATPRRTRAAPRWATSSAASSTS